MSLYFHIRGNIFSVNRVFQHPTQPIRPFPIRGHFDKFPLHDNIIEIIGSAFGASSLNTIEIPNSVKKIDADIFWGNDLVSVTFRSPTGWKFYNGRGIFVKNFDFSSDPAENAIFFKNIYPGRENYDYFLGTFRKE